MGFELKVGDSLKRSDFLMQLVEIQFERNEIELLPGRFRVNAGHDRHRPRVLQQHHPVETFGDRIERITEIDRNHGSAEGADGVLLRLPRPALRDPDPHTRERAIDSIREELDQRLPELGLLESHRLEQRTLFDLEMIEETGSCKGIENYSRHFDFRLPGEKPYCLLDYFPNDFLMVIDESHQTIPQVHGMYKGDRSRKSLAHRLRVPAAVRVRQPPPEVGGVPRSIWKQVIFVSATPGEYEHEGLGPDGRADHPADGARRPGGRGAEDRGPDPRRDRGDQEDDREGRAGAGHDAHQEARRGALRVARRPAGSRPGTSTPRSTQSSGPRSSGSSGSAGSTSSSGSTSSARGSTSPRSGSSGSSMRTRRGSSATTGP